MAKTKMVPSKQAAPKQAAPKRTASELAASEPAALEPAASTSAVPAPAAPKKEARTEINDALDVSINTPVIDEIIFKAGIPDPKVGGERKTRDHIKDLLHRRKNGEDIGEPIRAVIPSPGEEVEAATSADALLATLPEAKNGLRAIIQQFESDSAEKDEKPKTKHTRLRPKLLSRRIFVRRSHWVDKRRCSITITWTMKFWRGSSKSKSRLIVRSIPVSIC
ncbi:hypothetical protein BDZ45DRAFT_494948 [Acephala macrosclerotiorum]|nr:hypothetical protein BDZ45DRAFT_494948 [Acephala macrosclerotiorum]